MKRMREREFLGEFKIWTKSKVAWKNNVLPSIQKAKKTTAKILSHATLNTFPCLPLHWLPVSYPFQFIHHVLTLKTLCKLICVFPDHT